MTYFEVVGLCVLWGLFGWFLRGEREVYRQSRRLGGYVKPPASSSTSPADDGTSWTPLTPEAFSSSTRHGGQSAVTDVHPTLDPWSRRVAPISSGNVTAARGVNGRTRPEPAASPDPFAITPVARGEALLRRNRGDDAA